MKRIFYHESTHGIFDLQYECNSNPYFCNDTVKINEFNAAAKQTAILTARLLDYPLLLEELSQMTLHEIFSHLKESSYASIFWLNEIALLSNTFDESFNTNAVVFDDDLPFTNVFEFYSELSGHNDTCINPTSIMFQYPSQYLSPLAQQQINKVSHSKKYSEQEISFLGQMSSLVVLNSKDEYDFELIARAVEFAYIDNEAISQTLNPLFQYLETDFIPQINKMYENHIELVHAQIGTHFNVSDFNTVLNVLTEA